jgi:phosphatidylinositol N-acetylglucosaminyltransferase subunit A
MLHLSLPPIGIKACLTDHSLFGFADAASIHINKVLQVTLSDIDHVICVSNTCRENLVLRASLHPSLVSTIPNAVDATKFTPDPSQRYPSNTINIVLLSRLVYRKGIDLLVKIIPVVCAKFPIVHFIIGGDGPKKLLLEEMRERYQLHEHVELLGAVPHHQVRDVLVRGHVFLNCSLTESFCIALLEAASCGLFVVSTKVGGVPEVLPPSMIKFAEPTVADLVDALTEAVSISRRIVPYEMHERVRTMYNWLNVAHRTEIVYDEVELTLRPTLAVRLMKYFTVGPWAGLAVCFLVAALHLYCGVCERIWPDESIERCAELPWLQEAANAAGLNTRSSHSNTSSQNQIRGESKNSSKTSNGRRTSRELGSSGDSGMTGKERG